MAPTNIRSLLRLALVFTICSVGISLANKVHRKMDTSIDTQAEPGLEKKLAKEVTSLKTTAIPTEATSPLTTEGRATSAPRPTTPFNPYAKANASRAHRKAMRQARKGKSRRKRRGCKCVQRYMAEVDARIRNGLEEFKRQIQLQRHNDIDTQRVGDALLRLSGDVAEAQKDIRALTASIANLRDNLPSMKKDMTRTARHVHRLDSAVANLSMDVDNLERRLSTSGLHTAYLLARQPHGMTPSQISDQETSTQPKPMPTQCDDVYKTGATQFLGDYYIMIKPKGVPHAFKALCKMVNNSGWTVIQKRQDGSVNFYRDWNDYRVGFGTLEGEFWMGNDNIHALTSQEDTMLRIEMEDWSGEKYFAIYDHFKVDGPASNFLLHISGYRGDAGDSMNSVWENHDNMPFSTKDRDNDARYYDSCAVHYQGAWWFNNCFEAHLNGKYYTKGFHQNYFQRDGIQWNTIHMYSSLKAVQMMVKPADSKKAHKPNTEA